MRRLVDGRSAGGHRRAAARGPRTASACPRDFGRRLPRRRALPHRRRPDARAAVRTAASTAPIRGSKARHLRRRPPEAVVDEMERLRRELGTAEQFVVDSSFNADEDHMTAVCEELRRRRSRPGALLADVSFSCYLQPRVSDPDVFRLLAAAGCTSVDFGIDTAAEEVLPGFGKSFTIEDIRESTAAAKAAGIDVCHSLLFGGPGRDAGHRGRDGARDRRGGADRRGRHGRPADLPGDCARPAGPRCGPDRRAPVAAGAALLRGRA